MPLTPYQLSARKYVKRGWSPVPMTAGSADHLKGVPREGLTGRDGIVVDDAWLDAFLVSDDAPRFPNVSVRAYGWVGIDVDNGYGGKYGAAQLAEAEEILGKLPPTYFSTARGPESGSGIWFYQVPVDSDILPEGSNFATILAPGEAGAIEIIRREHRYAKCWPTVHPNGELYRWYAHDGFQIPEGEMPAVHNLPRLPEAWLTFLTTENRAGHLSRRPLELTAQDSLEGDRVFDDSIERGPENFLRAHRNACLTTQEGSGFNNVLNQYAHALAGFVPNFYTAEQAEELCEEVCREHWSAPNSADRATIRSGLRSRPKFTARRPTAAERADVFSQWFNGPVSLAPLYTATAEQVRLAQLAKLDPMDPAYDAEVAKRIEEQASRGYFLPDEFWSNPEFPAFAHLRQAAWAKMASPDATLLAAMTRVVTYVGPQVKIPSWVGSMASLNFGGVIVGDSGAAKSSSVGLAEETLRIGDTHRQNVPLPEYHTFCPSSPQGLSAQYQRYTRGNLERTRMTAVCDVDEGDQLRAVWEKQGIGIIAELRKALMGKALGYGNVGETRTNLPAHSYRFSMIMCTLPTHADWILSDDVGGFPQRLVWACAEDSRVLDDVSWPGVYTVPIPTNCHVDLTNAILPDVVLTGDDAVIAEIRADHRRRRELGLADGDLDGHATLTRMKVAWIFALLHGRTHIRHEHEWAAAATFMASSNAVRRYAQTLIAEKNAKEAHRIAVGRGKSKAIEEQVFTESKESELRSRVTRRVIGYITTQPGITKSDLRRKFNSTPDARALLGDRGNPQVLDALLQTGQIRFENIERNGEVVGSRWFIGSALGNQADPFSVQSS